MSQQAERRVGTIIGGKWRVDALLGSGSMAAVARQAAGKLGAPRAKTGTLDEVAPLLFDSDRARLEAWTARRQVAEGR